MPPFDELQAAVALALSTPAFVDGTRAFGTLTISAPGVSDGETVTIGARVYEFDTAIAPGAITPGRVRVDVSGGASAPAAVTALVAAITGDVLATVTAVDGTGDTVVVTAKAYGVGPNATATTETCANATWGAFATLHGGTLGGSVVGVYCPVAPEKKPDGTDVTLPYIILGEDFVSDWSTKTSWGTEHLLRFHVWDGGDSSKRTKRIAAGIVARLVDVNLTVGGSSYVCVLTRMGACHFFTEEEEGANRRYFHGVVDVRALIQQA
jgi:hypothetical protein